VSVIFEIGSCKWLSWTGLEIFEISTSWIARITGPSHQLPTNSLFKKLKKKLSFWIPEDNPLLVASLWRRTPGLTFSVPEGAQNQCLSIQISWLRKVQRCRQRSLHLRTHQSSVLFLERCLLFCLWKNLSLFFTRV
jgi:hypothetical protein